jgi:outer membrane lipoprotein-sorting protein
MGLSRNVNVLFVSLLVVVGLFAQRPSRPSAQEIMLSVDKAFEEVKDFVVTIEAEINMEQVRVPKSNATMYFKKPDRVHFTSTSFAIIPRDGLALNPALLREKYDASFVAEEKTDGKKIYKLQLAAKDPKTRLRQMHVWIDSSNWTIIKMETIPYEGRTLSIDFVFGLLQGRFWLPTSMKATFGVASGETAKPGADTQPSPAPQLEEMQRAPRSGSISIVYSNYKINVNLPDEIFERKEGK